MIRIEEMFFFFFYVGNYGGETSLQSEELWHTNTTEKNKNDRKSSFRKSTLILPNREQHLLKRLERYTDKKAVESQKYEIVPERTKNQLENTWLRGREDNNPPSKNVKHN